MAIYKNDPGRESLTSRRLRQDWTQGNILKNLLLLSWPIAVTNTLMTLGPTIDMIWVGKLGDVAIAAVGVSGVVVMLASSAMMGLGAGMRALIARFIGARDEISANHVAQQATVVIAAYCIIIAIVGIFFSEQILQLVGVDPDVVKLGAAYLRINFIGQATMGFRMLMDSIMQAAGDSINPMKIVLVYRLIHILLCPFLIFGSTFASTVFPHLGFNFSGWWPLPAMGVIGAALTDVISQMIGAFMGLGVLFGEKSRLRLSYRGFRLDPVVIWRIVRIGLPALVSGTQRTLNMFFITVFMAPFGTIALAAHAIIQRIEMFIATPAMSIGMGAGVLVGQNLGAKQPERAEKSVWLALAVVEVFVVMMSLVMLVWTGPTIRIFGNEPALVNTSSEFLHIALVGYISMGFSFVLMNALQGAGDTVPTMIISIVTTWLITIPLAYFLPKFTDWGAYSIRWAMSLSMVVAAIANPIYFRTGKWKLKKV